MTTEHEDPSPDAEIEVEITPEPAVGADAAVEVTDDLLQQQLDAAKKSVADAEARAADAEKRARDEAERNRQLQTEAGRTKADLVNSNVQVIANAINAAELEMQDVQDKLEAAWQSGDFKAAAQLQTEIAGSAVKLQRLNEGKSALESRIEQERERPAVPADPVEAYAASLSPRAQSWVLSHREVVTDSAKTAELTRAHYRALGAGIAEGSDAYFQHMDQEMGYARRPDAVQEQAPVRSAAAPAAPVSREGSRTAATSPTTIRLSAAEREIARATGLSDAEYGRHKLAILRENGTTH